jgi:hypothetical protein
MMSISENIILPDQAHIPTTKSSPGGVGFDCAFLVPCAWLVGGIFLDGWAHTHIPSLETFFTPWHAVLYSGYLAVAAFLAGILARNHQHGAAWQHALPAGYGLSFLGVVIFGVGGGLDLTWHLLFGIEKSVDALLSPTHLILAFGVVLMVSGPLRAAWYRPSIELKEGWTSLFPMILSLTFLLAILSFFTQYADPIVTSWANQFTSEPLRELGITSILLQAAILMGGILPVVRRWSLPFGAFAIIFLIKSALSSVLAGNAPVITVAVVGAVIGVMIDLVYRWLKPSVERGWVFYLFALVVPIVNTSVYFLGLAVIHGIAWSVNLWAGSIVLSGVVGLLLSYMLVPPQLPKEQKES